MPLGDLLNSTNTTEEGRVIINSAYTRTCLWTGSTGSFTGITKNIIANNEGGNTISGVNSPIDKSYVEYSSILGGSNNSLSGSNPYETYIKNSSIVGGEGNLITYNNGSMTISNSIIVGGSNNRIRNNGTTKNVAVLGSNSLTGDTSNTTYTKGLQSSGARYKKFRPLIVVGTDYASTSSSVGHKIEDDDEFLYITNFTFAAQPASNWCLDITDFLKSKEGRCVEIIVNNYWQNNTTFSFSSAPIRLGTDYTPPGGSNKLNEVTVPTGVFTVICEPSTIGPSSSTGSGLYTGFMNFTHVKLILNKSSSGLDNYVAIGGTGAP
tara:strand:- start:1100 stop:2065 length:966 start_codon:yes stop_codon:yes gene_type:complete